MAEVWDALEGLIDGREELFILGRDSNTLLDWQVGSMTVIFVTSYNDCHFRQLRP